MVDRRGEDATAVDVLEGLGQGGAVVGVAIGLGPQGVEEFGRVQNRSPAHQADRPGVVDEGHRDGIIPDEFPARIDKVPGVVAQGRVDLGHQGLQREGVAGKVVLDLDQADNIRVHADDRVHQLGGLAGQLFLVFRTARGLTVVHQTRERGEVVENVQRSDLEIAAHIGGLLLHRVGGIIQIEVDTFRQTQAVFAKVIVHDRGQTGDRLAHHRRIRIGTDQVAIGFGDRVIIAARAVGPVVDQDGAIRNFLLVGGIAVHVRRVGLAVLVDRTITRQQRLPVVLVVEAFREGQRLVNGDQHAFQRLAVVQVRQGRGDGKGQGIDGPGFFDADLCGLDRGLAETFHHGAQHAHTVARCHIRQQGGAFVDEDPFRGHRVRIAVRQFLHQEETAEFAEAVRIARLVIARDDGLDHHGLAGHQAFGSAALNRADQRGFIVDVAARVAGVAT